MNFRKKKDNTIKNLTNQDKELSFLQFLYGSVFFFL